MSAYYYEQIRAHGRKSGKCVACGKPAERSHIFTNTVNPFNKNEDGTVKTRLEVQANVNRLARAWEAEPLLHKRCES